MSALFKYVLFFVIALLGSVKLSAQTVSSIIVDAQTKSPIAYASILLKNKHGVISNEEGAFSLNIEGLLKTSDSVYISSMGYENSQFLLSQIKDSLFIQAKEIALNEVIVSNKNFTASEIVAKVQAALAVNHPQRLSTKRLFYRSSELQNMSRMDVKFEKSSIKEINKKFLDSVMELVPKKSAYYTEILADLSGDYSAKNQKINLIKASNLYDKNNEVSLEGMENKFNSILEQNVKKDSYLKVKSGWFSTKVSSDDIFIEENKIDSSNQKLLDSLASAKKKKDLERKTSFASYRKNRIGRLFGRQFFNEDSPFNFLFKDNKYHITLEDYTYVGALPVYKLRFISKGSADYNATLYINADDFAVVRLDFKNYQHLKKINLLGFSYLNYLNEGKAFFSKTDSIGYTLSYLEENSAEKVGIKRPIKIVEKNKFAKGRRKQNELEVTIHFEINTQNKNEIVVFSNKPLSAEKFKALEEKNLVLPTYLPAYDPAFWEGYNIIAPNQAIKTFSAQSSGQTNN